MTRPRRWELALPADLREPPTPQLNAGQKAVVALKVRELLQPMAGERQRERTDLKPKAVNIRADLREGVQPQLSALRVLAIRPRCECFNRAQIHQRQK